MINNKQQAKPTIHCQPKHLSNLSSQVFDNLYSPALIYMVKILFEEGIMFLQIMFDL